MITSLRASIRFQLWVLRKSPDYLMSLVTIPLLAIAFLAIMEHAGRADLAPFAVLGSGLMTIWATALFVCGEVIDLERRGGTLEGLLAAPAPYVVLIVGRIAVTTVVSFLGLLESALVVWLVLGEAPTVAHPGLLVVVLICTAVGMIGTASIMSAVFVHARSPRIFQNSLSYPFYVLGGAVVPTDLLPGWLQPVSKIIFLSWASALLRDCLRPQLPTQVPARLGAVLGLGLAGLAVGVWLTRRLLDRLRATGELGFA